MMMTAMTMIMVIMTMMAVIMIMLLLMMMLFLMEMTITVTIKREQRGTYASWTVCFKIQASHACDARALKRVVPQTMG